MSRPETQSPNPLSICESLGLTSYSGSGGNFVFALFAITLFSMGNTVLAQIQIDAKFPGGNILVSEIEGNDVYIAQDLRDTRGWWFYYNFRVSGAAGRKLTFHWTKRNPMTSLGPAVCADGRSWEWLGKDRVNESSFEYHFSPDSKQVQFCLAIPYQLADLERFILKHRDNPAFQSHIHATTAGDRPVYRLHFGCIKRPKYRVLLMCRHHSCEMMASYVLEGAVDAVLADDKHGQWFRQNVEFMAIPIMDVDGVEAGDQGKNRKPHDHNRDYGSDSIYPSVVANKEFIPEWSKGKLRMALDLHCPFVRGGGDKFGSNERIYFVGSANDQEMNKLATILETTQTGPLRYATRHNLPWGESWNNRKAGLESSSTGWAGTLPGVKISSTIEIPYALVGTQPITRNAARSFGRDITIAIQRYLQN